MMPRIKTIRSSTFVLCSALAASSMWTLTSHADAIEIGQALWGFDGKVAAGRFNPLSVLLINDSPKAYDGVVRLRRQLGGGQTVGALIEEPVFVAPFGRRWVQLYPFINDGWAAWELSMSGGGKSLDVPAPKVADAPVVVLLKDPDTLAAGGGSIKRFSSALFPPSVTSTDALSGVVLDHAPRWQQARRSSLAEWLYRGGQIHLVRDSDGEYPKFSGELAVLNAPLDEQSVGAGTVIRHDISRKGLTNKFVREEILPQVVRQQGRMIGPNADEVNKLAQEDEYYYDASNERWRITDHLLRSLRGMTRPDHSWDMIHLASLGYIMLLGPGCWWVSRGQRPFWMSLGALALLVISASWLFATIGRRGYDEVTTVNSVAVAKPVGDSAYDVTQWSDSFVTDGDIYTITHEGTGRLYSTAQSNERVSGRIDNGAEGSFRVDIPPYSSRGFTLRQRIALQPPKIIVENWDAANDRLLNLKLTVDENFPSKCELLSVVYRDGVYPLRHNGKTLSLLGSQHSIAEFINGEHGTPVSHQYGYYMYEHEQPKVIYKSLTNAMSAYGLGLNTLGELRRFDLPPDRIKLLFITKMPQEMFPAGDDLGQPAGNVLFQHTILKPETP